ncbi:sugar fermentation stimulation protein A [Succinivibrio dextrinosolvens DSM 3072]|uniref:Sugar fermentation stimulation protein homolog n=1 Tax=Succinivibrio dextrinosolvens DSM 3072 TaxID=1123324 RepID=A0A1T4V4S8_9GAMM|nr:DNA/RNA nuclease SfsA [Succinivibrio dextrinosolvens]SKA60010.1 sugar fermentation stimulation protein A [Succinivibrio dextrinosolvens DSM 3072]
MQYSNIYKATFLERPNRFIARVFAGDKVETVHVKNTGRCRELLLPDSQVILSKSDSKERKTQYDLIAVYKKGLGLVNIDSQAPNTVMKEWLTKYFDFVRPEYRYGKSRIDFYLEKGNKRYLVEVKGCTLEKEGIGYFPDAPTERGVRHIYELIDAREKGDECALAFVIQMPQVNEVRPNIQIQPEFGTAWNDALKAGVRIWFLGCDVTEEKLSINNSRVIVEL